MTFDLTVKITDIIMIVAVIIGPLLAVKVTLWAQDRNDKITAKRNLFLTLIGDRNSIIASDARVRSLNSIDVVFSGNKNVIDLWHKHFELLSKDHSKERDNTWHELLSAMAEDLKMGRLSPIELDKFYIPQSHLNYYESQQKISAELLRVLENTEHFLLEKKT